MGFHLQFRRYRLPLRTTIRTAHEVWTERQGIVIRLEDSEQQVGFGEIAPIPAFGTETVELAEAALREVGEWPTAERLATVPRGLGCVHSAIRSALADAGRPAGAAAPATVAQPVDASGKSYRAVAALLPSGAAAVPRLHQQAENGFRVFKWKVGVGDPADELGQLDDVCAALPSGGRLRLDANGAWDRRQAERWLERCAERPVEFVEQPCFTPRSQGETALRRTEDLLFGLAHDFPTPIALDESVVGDSDVERWLGAGWPGWFVLKPSLVGDMPAALALLSAAHATVVFSSALETAVGARAALRAAFSWTGETKALGFGVWPLFSDAQFDGPFAAPFLRAEDVSRIDVASVWNALN